MYLLPRTTFFLIFLYISCAFPLPTASEHSTDNIYGTRSIWSIIWSCLSIISACTWIAVHPNIPGPKDSKWTVLCKRMKIMGCFIFAPGIVLGWAAKQHWAARLTVKRYHREHGWTMAHGFFIGMGGFTLHDQTGKAVRILDSEGLEKLYNEGKVAWPSITEEEIEDRSNGDHLSKGFVLVQMSWFIIQFILRAAYGLAVTLFEVQTLSFAIISGATYYLWWHKPLDVRCSVPVYLLPPLNQDPQSPISEEIQNPQQSFILPNHNYCSSSIVHNHNDREPNSSSTSVSNSTRVRRLPAFIQRHRQKHGILVRLAEVFIHDSLLEFLEAVGEISSSITHHPSPESPPRVPTFYSPWDPRDTNQRQFFIIRVSFPICIAAVLGGIHCIAWSFQFPSPQEQLAWRISAAFITAEPILFGLLIHLDKCQVTILSICIKALFISLSVMYFVARILLLILPCITLRALPPSALIEIQWTSLIPHIS